MMLSLRPFCATSQPHVEARELPSAYLTELIAPGIKTDDLEVSVGNGHVQLEATLRAAKSKTLTIPVDGMFGPRTVKALQSLLKQNGQKVGPMDGRFGPRTVRATQEFLTLRNYEVGPIDGRFGKRTARAVQQWLNDVDVCEGGFSVGPVDGAFGPRSVAALQMTLNALKVPAEHDAKFVRTVELPRDADLDSADVTVTHNDGVLAVLVPKKASAPVRRLDISSGAREADSASGSSGADIASGEGSKADAEWEEVAVLTPEAQLRAKLAAEGFKEEATVELLLELHGADEAKCLADARRLAEWTSSLDDLVECGFADLSANKRALLKHEGSLKAAVKELVRSAKDIE